MLSSMRLWIQELLEVEDLCRSIAESVQQNSLRSTVQYSLSVALLSIVRICGATLDYRLTKRSEETARVHSKPQKQALQAAEVRNRGKELVMLPAPKDFIQNVLSMPLILDRILKHLPAVKILECSLVSKSWRDICRRYLRKRRVFVVALLPNCAHLRQLNDLLQNSVDLPFVGLYFHDLKDPPSSPFLESARQPCECFKAQTQSVISLYPRIFRKLDLKILKIHYIKRANCIADKFLQEILRYKTQSMDEMRISYWPDDIPSLWSYANILHTSTLNLFPFLRTCIYEVWPNNPLMIREIQLSAPKLSHLLGNLRAPIFYDNSSQIPRFPKDKYTAVKSLRGFDPEILCRLEKESVRLRFLHVAAALTHTDDELVKEAQKGVAAIGKSSSESLSTFECHYNMIMLRALLVSRHSFPHLSVLSLALSKNRYCQVNFLLLKCTDFAHFFPKLRTVDVRLSRKVNVGYVEDYTILLEELKILSSSPAFICESVTDFCLHFEHDFETYERKWSCWNDFAKIFPNVHSLTIQEPSNIGEFWKCATTGPWKHLQSLNYSYDKAASIFPRDLLQIIGDMELKQRTRTLDDAGDNALKDSLPSDPSTTFTSVRTLRIFFDHKGKEQCSAGNPLYTSLCETAFSFAILWLREQLPGFQLKIVVTDCCSKECDPFKLNHRKGVVQVMKFGNEATTKKSTWTLR